MSDKGDLLRELLAEGDDPGGILDRIDPAGWLRVVLNDLDNLKALATAPIEPFPGGSAPAVNNYAYRLGVLEGRMRAVLSTVNLAETWLARHLTELATASEVGA